MTEYTDEKDKKWNELKSKWSASSSSIKPKIQENPKLSLNENKTDSKSFSDIVNLLQKQLEKKQATLKEIQSNDLLDDLEKKKQRLDDNVVSKKQHILELRSKQQLLQKEIIRVIKEIKDETEIKTNEILSVNEQLSKLTSHFNIQKNHPDFIAIGGTSGENDRYVKIPHAAYEFKIPIEQIGFEDEYGFFMQVFDGDDVMTYPNEHSGKYPQKIPSPKQWGLMISPDRSISSEHFNQN